jgi:hypothetical protein
MKHHLEGPINILFSPFSDQTKMKTPVLLSATTQNQFTPSTRDMNSYECTVARKALHQPPTTVRNVNDTFDQPIDVSAYQTVGQSVKLVSEEGMVVNRPPSATERLQTMKEQPLQSVNMAKPRFYTPLPLSSQSLQTRSREIALQQETESTPRPLPPPRLHRCDEVDSDVGYFGANPRRHTPYMVEPTAQSITLHTATKTYVVYMSTTLVPFLSNTLDGDPSDREGRLWGGATTSLTVAATPKEIALNLIESNMFSQQLECYCYCPSHNYDLDKDETFVT